MVSHVGADEGRVGLAALGEFAVAVALAPFGAFGLGMAQQHQTAHGGNVAFRTLKADSSAADLKFLPRCGNVGWEQSFPPPQVRKTME